MKNYQKLFVTLLLTIVALVVVGGVAYYFGTRQESRIDTSNNTEEINARIPVVSTEDINNSIHDTSFPSSISEVSVKSSKPAINVISPNGKENIKLESVQNITWSSTSLGTSTITINLVDESKVCSVGIVGCQASYVIDFGVKNTGSYLWDTNKKMSGPSTGPNSVSIIPGSKYRIKICKDYSDICDSSNNYFTIVSSADVQLLKVCPEFIVDNKMPTVYPNNNPPSKYYILHGVRMDIVDFDADWIKNNCSVETKIVY